MIRVPTGAGNSGSTLRKDLLSRDITRRSALKSLTKAAAANVGPRNDLLPKLRLIDRAPDLLRIPPRNVRMIEPAHVRELANSMALLGFTVPVLIDNEGTILDGVTRVEAAKLLGLATIPCIVADHLTASERKLLRVAANRLGEKGTWNFDTLKVELEELILDEAPIEIGGFELAEIDGILCETAAAIEQGPLVPAENQRAVAQIGDVYRLGRHELICGDATDPEVLRRLMRDDEARLVFTDQPYNVPISGHVTGGAHREFEMASGELSDAEFAAFNAAWIGAALPHLSNGGMLATFIDWRGLMSVSAAALNAGLSQLNLVVWAKTNAGMGSLYRSQHEMLPLFKKGATAHVNNVDLGRKGRWRSNLWTYPGASTIGSDARRGLQHHPTVKPVTMLLDAMLDLTSRGDIVLDPFLGSGSTLMAAEKAHRVCRGIELDPLYVDVIARRFELATGRPAILAETGETFQALERRRLATPVEAPMAAACSVGRESPVEAAAPAAPTATRIRTRIRA